MVPTVALTWLPCTRIRSEMLHIAKGLAEKTKRSSQLHASISGGAMHRLFRRGLKGQHTRIAPVLEQCAAFSKVGVGESPLPQGTLGNSSCPKLAGHSRLYQALSMRCNGRREHYLPILGGYGCPTSSSYPASCEASSWEFSLFSPGQHVARAASRGLFAHPALAVSCN